MQELNTDFAKMAPMGKTPLTVLKEFEHQARQNLCTLIFSAAFTTAVS